MTYEKIGDIVLVKTKDTTVNTNYRLLALVSKTNLNIFRINEYVVLDVKPVETIKIVTVLKKYKLSSSGFNTIHFENKLRFYVNISEMYFSTKYSTYRAYLKSAIKDKRIIVMFNGCGPYAVTLAKDNKYVIGMDINYKSCEYFEINSKINKVNNCTSFKSEFYDFIVKDFDCDCLISVLPSLIFNYWPYIDRQDYLEHYCLMLIEYVALLKLIQFFSTYYNCEVKYSLIRSYSKFAGIFSLKFVKKTKYALKF